MQVTNLNDVKQYNLTQGRSLPDWLDERKRRKLLSVSTQLTIFSCQNVILIDSK